MEEDATRSSDITLCVSEIDYNCFKSLNNNAPTYIIPNGTKKYTDSDTEFWIKKFKGTRIIGFLLQVGMLNIEGILRLINAGLDSFDSKETKLWIFWISSTPDQ